MVATTGDTKTKERRTHAPSQECRSPPHTSPPLPPPPHQPPSPLQPSPVVWWAGGREKCYESGGSAAALSPNPTTHHSIDTIHPYTDTSIQEGRKKERPTTLRLHPLLTSRRRASLSRRWSVKGSGSLPVTNSKHTFCIVLCDVSSNIPTRH